MPSATAILCVNTRFGRRGLIIWPWHTKAHWWSGRLVKLQFAHLRGFHDDWAKNVTSRVILRLLKSLHYIHIEKNAPSTGGHVFSQIWTIFELVRDINKTNCLQGFSIAPPGNHVIELTRTIFELNSHIKETNVLTKFHENWAKNVTSRVLKK
ncbi:hypothetical protein DPMN_060906 [Dreissena polymorpha]|uniref:Uncharacterized protein n=1 Tax=Dreissena polymorpha TaxID=45954 RepID=A0A9D4C629_DREPO|nr:hypothetical protein DPMN_060906 [Dreissena polymorpha]